ncbi:hypothetical protein MUG91_G7n149 [Manis pentadactyla]|nr:hypothetical protein MUG91_G7n149 [Manis pentadactyla]
MHDRAPSARPPGFRFREEPAERRASQSPARRGGLFPTLSLASWACAIDPSVPPARHRLPGRGAQGAFRWRIAALNQLGEVATWTRQKPRNGLG